MSVNPNIGIVGVAKQVDRATPAANPTFTHGLTGGQNFKVDRSLADANVACGMRAGTDSYVDAITTGVDFETYGYADVIPLYFFSAMGSIASVASTKAGYFDHTIKLGDVLPYLTFWGRIGNEDITVTDSAKIDQLELSFDGNTPLAFGVTAVGCKAHFMDGVKNIPGDVDPSCFDGYFVCTDGSFKLDTAGDTPIESFVTAGNISLGNSITEYRKAGQVMPDDVAEKRLTTSGSITAKPDDLSEYRKLITGDAHGEVPSGTIVYGSFDLTFVHSKDADMSLRVTATHVPFNCEFPSVDPEGDAATLDFAWDNIGIESRDGSPITVIVTNKTAAY